MTIIEQLARFLAAKLRLPFEGNEANGAVFFGYMPAEPVKAMCVYANDLRAPGDMDGARVQIVIRSDMDGAWPLEKALQIMRLMDEQRDLIFTPDGYYVNRIVTEKGFEFSGLTEGNTQMYAANFRIYYCG